MKADVYKRQTRNLSFDRWKAKNAQKRGNGIMDTTLDELAECIPCLLYTSLVAVQQSAGLGNIYQAADLVYPVYAAYELSLIHI